MSSVIKCQSFQHACQFVEQRLVITRYSSVSSDHAHALQVTYCTVAHTGDLVTKMHIPNTPCSSALAYARSTGLPAPCAGPHESLRTIASPAGCQRLSLVSSHVEVSSTFLQCLALPAGWAPPSTKNVSALTQGLMRHTHTCLPVVPCVTLSSVTCRAAGGHHCFSRLLHVSSTGTVDAA